MASPWRAQKSNDQAGHYSQNHAPPGFSIVAKHLTFFLDVVNSQVEVHELTVHAGILQLLLLETGLRQELETSALAESDI